MIVGLTHSRGALPDLDTLLARSGVPFVWKPLVATESMPAAEIERLLMSTKDCDWLVFSSRAAVAAVASAGQVQGLASGSRPRVAAVGRGTAQAAELAGLTVDLEGEGDAASTAEGLLRSGEGPGIVGLVQGSNALPTLAEGLSAGGWDVRRIVVYRTRSRPWSGPVLPVTFFASPSAVQAFGPALHATRAVAIGHVTADAVAAAGSAAVVCASPQVGDVAARLIATAEEVTSRG